MKLIKLLVLSLLFTLLIGCEDNQIVNEVQLNGKRFNGIDANTINIVTDSETGCKYIFVDDGQGNYRTTAMSPLIKASGVPDCGK